MSSLTALILVFFLQNYTNFLAKAHQTNPRPPYNQEPLISTYFSPSSTGTTSSSSANPSSSPTTSAQKQSPLQLPPQPSSTTAHYLAYPNPTSFYHQNVYLTSPQSSSGISGSPNQPVNGMSTSYSYGFGAPGATNLYTYGSAAAAAAGTGGGNSPLMLASGSSTQSVMTTVPMSGHQESKMLAASDPMSMSSGTPPPNGDKNSKSPLGIVFGRPMSSYDGNYYVPVF